MTSYPVLSLSPPYGSLIALLLKGIETRGWQTSHRGPLLIHQTAAPGPKGTTEDDLHRLLRNRPLCDAGGLFDRLGCADSLQARAALPRGKIIALVELHDCTPIGALPDGTATYMAYDEFPPVLTAVQEPELSFGDYTPGRWAWLLSNVRPLPTPIAARGMPGLWRWEGDLGI